MERRELFVFSRFVVACLLVFCCVVLCFFVLWLLMIVRVKLVVVEEEEEDYQHEWVWNRLVEVRDADDLLGGVVCSWRPRTFTERTTNKQHT